MRVAKTPLRPKAVEARETRIRLIVPRNIKMKLVSKWSWAVHTKGDSWRGESKIERV